MFYSIYRSADPTTAPPTFNPNVAFDLLDANKDGKVEKLEYDSTFASYDANSMYLCHHYFILL